MVTTAAVIGIGNIARYHLAALERQPNVTLVAVCDLSPAAAEAAAERYGAARWYTDHRQMLTELSPAVVHITTPPASHAAIAIDCLDAGAHVLVEKPAAPEYQEVLALTERARHLDRILVEDYTYLFSQPVTDLLDVLATGDAGAVLHVEVGMCLDILGEGAAFADPAYPSHQLRGGAISDFLPHLASLTHAVVGPHRTVSTLRTKHRQGTILPSDELRALVDAERGSASILFSANSQPDALWVRVHAHHLRITASVFDPRVTVERVRSPRAITGLLNGLSEAGTAGRAAIAGVTGKVSGRRHSLDGIDHLIDRLYAAVAAGAAPPVSLDQVCEVNRLVADLVDDEHAL